MSKLHITIGSTPNIENPKKASKEFLQNDLDMIKASLLYADKATICSFSSSALLEIASIREIPENKRVEFFNSLLELLPNDPNVKLFKAVMEMAKSQGINVDQFIKSTFSGSDGWNEMKGYIDILISDVGGEGIFDAIKLNLLDIYKFQSILHRAVQESEHKNLTLEYVSVVSQSVSDAQTYPLFDQDTNEVISAGIQAGIIPVKDFAVTRGKEIGFAADIISRLPTFPSASIKEIIDVRSELDSHLVRFRSAMIKFSEDIQSASWDNDFVFDAETVFRKEIEPEVQNIEEEVKSNKFIAELLRKLTDKSFTIPSGSGIALALTPLPIPAIASIAIGTLVGGGSAVYDTYKEYNKKNREVQKNNLYFYYKAGNIL